MYYDFQKKYVLLGKVSKIICVLFVENSTKGGEAIS